MIFFVSSVCFFWFGLDFDSVALFQGVGFSRSLLGSFLCFCLYHCGGFQWSAHWFNCLSSRKNEPLRKTFGVLLHCSGGAVVMTSSCQLGYSCSQRWEGCKK